MGMVKEFREFAMQGSVVDLAVGVIIGAAFGKIVTSFVEDVIMPPIGLLLGKVDFASLFINLTDTPVSSIAMAKAAGVPVIAYGAFLNQIINFVIVAFVVFMVIRWMNKLKREKPIEAAAAPELSGEERLLTEIRDLLKK